MTCNPLNRRVAPSLTPCFALLVGACLVVSSCKMVAVPKGPARTVEKVIRREAVGRQEVVSRDLAVALAPAPNTPTGAVRLKTTVKERCGRRLREVYRVDQVREFKVRGCHGAAGLLCAILPATILTAIAGVPLGAMGINRLREKRTHDSNAVGMVAAGSLLLGLGLAGVVSCPIARFMERKCRRLQRRVKRGQEQRRVVLQKPGDCGTKLLRSSWVQVSTTPNPQGNAASQAMEEKTDSRGGLLVDMLEVMAQSGRLSPPETLYFNLPAKSSAATGSAAQSPSAKSTARKGATLKLSLPLRKKLAAATRRETISLAPGATRLYSRPLGNGVRYRVLKLVCTQKLVVALETFTAEEGRVWLQRGTSTPRAKGGPVTGVSSGAKLSLACSSSSKPTIFLLAPRQESGAVRFRLNAKPPTPRKSPTSPKTPTSLKTPTSNKNVSRLSNQ